MKNIIFVLLISSLGLNAMELDQGKSKYIKVPDNKIYSYQRLCRDKVYESGLYTTMFSGSLAFKHIRQNRVVFTMFSAFAMAHSYLLYRGVRAHNLAKQGLMERTGIDVYEVLKKERERVKDSDQ